MPEADEQKVLTWVIKIPDHTHRASGAAQRPGEWIEEYARNHWVSVMCQLFQNWVRLGLR